jgi:hypothetical protein
MEGLCVNAGAALILTHHFAKGDASVKNAIDRASGGGVFARWGDVMLTFTPHEEDDAMTVEMTLRNFKPVEPFVVRWEYPRWQRDGQLDPAALKNSRGAKERHSPEGALNSLSDSGMMYAEWLKASGLSESTFRRKRQELLDFGKVELRGVLYFKSKGGQPSFSREEQVSFYPASSEKGCPRAVIARLAQEKSKISDKTLDRIRREFLMEHLVMESDGGYRRTSAGDALAAQRPGGTLVQDQAEISL